MSPITYIGIAIVKDLFTASMERKNIFSNQQLYQLTHGRVVILLRQAKRARLGHETWPQLQGESGQSYA